jgi:hypothetical protein
MLCYKSVPGYSRLNFMYDLARLASISENLGLSLGKASVCILSRCMLNSLFVVYQKPVRELNGGCISGEVCSAEETLKGRE